MSSRRRRSRLSGGLSQEYISIDGFSMDPSQLSQDPAGWRHFDILEVPAVNEERLARNFARFQLASIVDRISQEPAPDCSVKP